MNLSFRALIAFYNDIAVKYLLRFSQPQLVISCFSFFITVRSALRVV